MIAATWRSQSDQEESGFVAGFAGNVSAVELINQILVALPSDARQVSDLPEKLSSLISSVYDRRVVGLGDPGTLGLNIRQVADLPRI
jgi:hypothetical protein